MILWKVVYQKILALLSINKDEEMEIPFSTMEG
jgi:hypothetical protein